MKAVNLLKLYESMPPSELAVMTFESLVKGDNVAAKNMAMAVPKYTYTSADKEYVGRLNRIFDVASLWSIEYWKCYCKMLACLGKEIQSRTSNTQNESVSNKSLELIWEGRLCALGQILVSLNISHKLDIETIAKFSDAQSIYGLDITRADLSDDAREYYRNYLDYFKSLIDGKSIPKNVVEYLDWDS